MLNDNMSYTELHDRLIQVGFKEWQSDNMNGYTRRITFSKTSLMGPVAQYYADDYIILEHQGQASVERILAGWQAVDDVVKQRVLLVGYDDNKISTKSFWWGFKGWLEVRGYKLNTDDNCRKFHDLIYMLKR